MESLLAKESPRKDIHTQKMEIPVLTNNQLPVGRVQPRHQQ